MRSNEPDDLIERSETFLPRLAAFPHTPAFGPFRVATASHLQLPRNLADRNKINNLTKATDDLWQRHALCDPLGE